MSTLATPAPRQFFPTIRGIRIAEVFVLLFFCLVMGLPIMFMLIGSFNIAAPGSPGTGARKTGYALSPIRRL